MFRNLSIDKFTLKKIIKELKKWRAPATILLSLYIPPRRPISDVLNLLRQELSITDNIKLKRTRDAVQRALNAAIDRLTSVQNVPKNGLVIFCGEDTMTREFVCLMFSPPEPVPVFFYRTDKWFHLEFLEPMVEEHNVYGLIIIERDAATLGLLKGGTLRVLDEIEGYIPGKHQRGGQSQRRFDRIIEQMVDEFYKSVGDRANRYFLPLLEEGKLKGILVGGPGYSKDDFVKGDYLDYRLKQKIINRLIDVAYQGEYGLREMVMKAKDILKDQEYVEVQKAIEEFKIHLVKDDGLAIYGEEEIKQALEMGVLKILLVHEDKEEYDALIEKARKTGCKVYIVASNLPEADWIKKTFNGIVGILRYSIY